MYMYTKWNADKEQYSCLFIYIHLLIKYYYLQYLSTEYVYLSPLIAKMLESKSIRYRSNIFLFDRYLFNVNEGLCYLGVSRSETDSALLLMHWSYHTSLLHWLIDMYIPVHASIDSDNGLAPKRRQAII